jgi:hypothetical protein
MCGLTALTATFAVVGHCWPIIRWSARRNGIGNRRRRISGGQCAGFPRLHRTVDPVGACHSSLGAGKCIYRDSRCPYVVASEYSWYFVLGSCRCRVCNRAPLFDRLESQVSRVVAGSGKKFQLRFCFRSVGRWGWGKRRCHPLSTPHFIKNKKKSLNQIEALLLLISQQPIKQSMFIWRGLFQPRHGQ